MNPHIKSVTPHLSYKLLGTDIELEAGVPHRAVDATNQPNWKDRGSMFVFENGTDIDDDRCMLLHSKDYTINPVTKSPKEIHDHPFTQDELITLLEAARVALADADKFDDIAESLDISDEELKRLQEKLNNHMNP